MKSRISRFTFGPFRADLHSCELRKHGYRIKIQDLPLRLLATLAEQPGQVVTQEELRSRLWPSNTFVDFEDGLHTAVRKLREALNDDPRHPRYIETIPKRGYRFIGELQPGAQNNGGMAGIAEDEDRQPVLASDTSPTPRVRPRRDFKWFISFPVAILGIFALWWNMPIPPPHVLGIEQVTTSGKLDTPIRLVMDANRVFYIERNGDRWNLLQKSLDDGAPAVLRAPEDSAMPLDVSRDGSMLLVGTFKRRDEEKRLWIIPVNGGSPRALTRAGDAVFSPDAKEIVFMEDSALWTLTADGSGRPHKLANLPAAPSSLAWSPDGSRIRVGLSRGEGEIWEIAPDGSRLHQLPLDGLKSPCCGTWTRDGRYFIFTALYGKHSETWALREHGTWWRRSPRGPFRLTSGPDSPFSGAPSGDGRRIVFYNGPWRQQYLRLDLSSRQFSPAVRQNGPESFSRQGDWIAYNEAYGGGLFRSRPDGSASIELAPAKIGPTFPRWSPDGKSVVFIGGSPGQPGPYIVAADGGEPQRVLPGEGELMDADWSGDGSQLVMAHARSAKESDGFELWIVDRDSGRIQPIPGSEHLAMSRWSYDGHYISATRDDQTEIRLWDVEKREWRTIAHGTAFGISAWSADSRYLYFQDILAPGEPLYRYDSRSRRIEVAAEFSEMLRTGASRCAFFGLTPDGSPMMMVSRSFYDLFSAEVVLP